MADSAIDNVKDRRETWVPPPRPEWLEKVNRIGDKMDIVAAVPLDEASLTQSAQQNTGLSDFGEDGWRDHFRILVKSLNEEAKLNLFGRLLTRAELVMYLEARLKVTHAYALHPEIEDEQIVEPVFILGLGRSGTSILHQTMDQDDLFRSVRKWEALFPWPAPEEATYTTDPRIRRAQDHVDIIDELSPEWRGIHPADSELPVEDLEFTYLAFFSEVWSNAAQVPTFDRYFRGQAADYHFYWHKRILKLLQFKYKKPHWLLKNPTHMERIDALLKAYPDAKIILPHRDPIVTADSVVNTSGTIFYWRTDHPYCYDDTAAAWLDIDARVQMWDDVIDAVEDGRLRPGFFTNVLYRDFLADPMSQMEKIYSELRLPLDDAMKTRMLAFLNARHGAGHGNASKYEKSRSDDPRTQAERRKYERYQVFFGVPSEV